LIKSRTSCGLRSARGAWGGVEWKEASRRGGVGVGAGGGGAGLTWPRGGGGGGGQAGVVEVKACSPRPSRSGSKVELVNKGAATSRAWGVGSEGRLAGAEYGLVSKDAAAKRPDRKWLMVGREPGS
jgi:hypothetical protein